jgi:hypothetical protein
MYIGGTFFNVNGGTARNYAASFNAAGAVQPWNPNPSGEVMGIWHRGTGFANT